MHYVIVVLRLFPHRRDSGVDCVNSDDHSKISCTVFSLGVKPSDRGESRRSDVEFPDFRQVSFLSVLVVGYSHRKFDQEMVRSNRHSPNIGSIAF